MIRENTISRNLDLSVAGGIAMFHSNPLIEHNTITDNEGEGGGAILCGGDQRPEYPPMEEYVPPRITCNTFTTNDGGDRGGAIALLNGEADIINNLFVGNNVTGTGGGAIYAYSQYPLKTYASIVNNTFAYNWTTGGDPENGNGGAVLGRATLYSTTSLALINNVFHNNTARDEYAGNSAALNEFASASALFCGAYSDVSGSESYHYLRITPDPTSCITHLLSIGDPPIFGTGYRVSLSGPSYTPLDRGHDLDAAPYDKVPLEDRDGTTRPQGTSTDMGAYETQQ